jgi:SAM-dependent methyltransferase
MVVSGTPRAAATASPGELKVIWHDLECGGYSADLPLWRELAAARGEGPASEPILEVGCGSGRVALDLAASGHRMSALDIDPDLLEALRHRDRAAEVDAVRADARTFDLGRRDFALCIVPMQTIQLLGGARGRGEFLRRARAHLRPGGVLACAIVSDFECFDARHGAAGPAPETVELAGRTYVSRPVRVCAGEHSMLIERVRSIGHDGRQGRPERDVIELDLISARELEREAAKAGLRPARTRRIAATDEHLGSEVVVLDA